MSSFVSPIRLLGDRMPMGLPVVAPSGTLLGGEAVQVLAPLAAGCNLRWRLRPLLSESKPSGFLVSRNASTRRRPPASTRGATSTSTSVEPSTDPPRRRRDGPATHRRSNEDEPSIARAQRGLRRVDDHGLLGTHPSGDRSAIAVASGVEGDGVISAVRPGLDPSSSPTHDAVRRRRAPAGSSGPAGSTRGITGQSHATMAFPTRASAPASNQVAARPHSLASSNDATGTPRDQIGTRPRMGSVSRGSGQEFIQNP